MMIEELKEKAYKKKKDLPLYVLNVTHKISIRIAGLIKESDISPNTLSLLTIFLGILSAFLFSLPTSLFFFLGALMLEIYYIFDAVDGQYARLKEKTSITGAYLDYISNHIVHSLVFLGLGIGIYRFSENITFLLAGFFSAWGMLFMYIIFDARHTILLNKKIILSSQSPKEKEGKTSLPKRIFMILHKSCAYPTIMNFITLAAVVNLVLWISDINKDFILFKILIIYYALSLNLVWIFKATKVIKNRELDILNN